MRRADYRAEARAWRRRAQEVDAKGYAVVYGIDDLVRLNAHRGNRPYCEAKHTYDPVLACLLLALECEDDARRAKR